jgi:hypothetical protein
VKLRHSLFIAAISAAASLSLTSVTNVANAVDQAPQAAPAARGGVQSKGVSGQPAALPGQDTNANHPEQSTSANNGTANAPNNTAAANNHNNEHHRRMSARGQTFVQLYGYVPYNGLYNEGFGYNNGWYDYPGFGPYIDENAGVDDSGFTSSNTNGYGEQIPPAPPAQPTTSASAGVVGISPVALGARTEMIEAQARLLKEYQAKPEYQSALADLKKATDDFNAAVASARASLQQTPAYQQATAQKDHADQQVEAQQAAHEVQPTTSTASANPAGAFSEDVTKAAQQKLNAKAQLTVLQKKSINDNPAVQQARAKLDSSLAQFKAVQAKFAEVVMADKDWQAAKQKYDAANPKS